VTTDHLRRLLEQDARAAADEGQIRGVVRALKGAAVSPLLEILTETDDRAIRKVVLGLLGGEGGVPWRDLERFLRDPRWYVVRNAVQLAAAAGHPQLVDAAPRLLRHHDARVRREVVRALERFNGRPVTAVLTQALSDPDPSVRTLAARGVGRGGGREAEAALLAHIGEREFPSLSAEEVEAFLGAYAEVAQERAIPLLERLWKKRLLSSRPLNCRVAAVLALGRVQGPEAGKVLQEAARSPEPQIARAAAQAAQTQASLTPGSGS
jgi:HEAT repeat protein